MFQMLALCQEDKLASGSKYPYLTLSMHYHDNQLFKEWLFYSSYWEHENITYFAQKTICCYQK